MLQLLLIPICLIAGLLLRRIEEFRQVGPNLLNRLIVTLFLPCLILAFIPEVGENFSVESVLVPALMPWIVFIVSVFVFGTLGRIFSWSRAETGMLILVSGLGNTSFMGIPMLDALYGEKALPTVLVIDQLGSFLVVSSIATITAILYSDVKTNWRGVVFKVLTFPPFLVFLIAAALIPFNPLQPIKPLLMRLSAPMIPLAIISLGLQLKPSLSEIKKNFRLISMSLGYKMFFTPVMIWAIYYVCLKRHGLPTQVTIAEAAMAPMFTAAILTTQFKLKPEISSLIIFCGVVLSLITVPVCVFLMSGISQNN